MTLIEGVNGSYYQPCLSDIGTMYNIFLFVEFMYNALLSYQEYNIKECQFLNKLGLSKSIIKLNNKRMIY
jgi:hypothetical protein